MNVEDYSDRNETSMTSARSSLDATFDLAHRNVNNIQEVMD